MKLWEVAKPIKNKTTKIVDIPWEDETPANLPANAGDRSAASSTPPTSRSLGQSASSATTAAKSANVTLPNSAKMTLQDFLANNPDNGEEDEPKTQSTELTTVTPQNIPATLQQSLVASGSVAPEWHMVSNLPGNMKNAIRSLGKSLFAQYTSTPTDQIQMIGNVGGQGPNSQREVNAVANWATSEGEEVTSGTINFDKIMPGYSADIKVYNAEGVQIMLVRDEYGQYIYAWPMNQSKLNNDQSTNISQPASKRIGK